MIEQGNFVEVEGEDKSFYYLKCPGCENVIKKRRDSFLPGAHMVSCVLCQTSSPDIMLAGGELIQRKPQDFKQPTDFKK